MDRTNIIIAGSGGQGALRVGQTIAYAGLDEGKEVSWLPSYGPEMRGGTANCSVIVSNDEIPYPIVSEPDCCIVMNAPSLKKFEGMVRKGGMIILNESMIPQKVCRENIDSYYVPADAIAEEEGNKKGANMVLLGAYLALSAIVSIDSVYDVVEKSFAGAKEKYIESNKKLIKRGYDYIHEK